MTHCRRLPSSVVLVTMLFSGACADATGPTVPSRLTPVAEASVVLTPAAATSEWQDWPMTFYSTCTGLTYTGTARMHLVGHTKVWGGTQTEFRERGNLAGGVLRDNNGTTYPSQEVIGGGQTTSAGSGVAEYNYMFQIEPRGGGGVERQLYVVTLTWDPSTLQTQTSITAICR